MPLYLEIARNLGLAWLAGGLIGLERSYHGRAAGFRTHALVAIASAGSVMVCLTPILVPGVYAGGNLAFTPVQVAQGVMTGVGFLGAGVIFKEGVNVQGLTTAASVWATAALGLLFGLGETFPGLLAAGAVLATLLVLRWIELILPSRVYAWAVFRFRAENAPPAADLRAMMKSKGVDLAELSYARTQGGAVLEFSGNLRASGPDAFHRLAADLQSVDGLMEFDLQRISK